MVIRRGDRVVCSVKCDPPHRRNSIGIVTQVANMVWPIKVEWLDGTYDYYDDVELEVVS